MTTLRQFIRNKKSISKGERSNYNRSPKLQACPQKRAILVKVYTTVPKKPNSSIRKIVKARLSNGLYIRAAVSGQGHALQEHATVLIKANRVRDIPGIHYRVIRGPRDFTPVEKFKRKKSRSKHGIKLDKDAKYVVSAKSIELLASKTKK